MIFNFIISLMLLLNDSSDLEKKIDDYLKIKLADYYKYEFKIKSVPGSNISDDQIKIDENKEIKLSGKYLYVPVVVWKGERKFNSILTLEIKLFDEVLIARRNLRRAENLSRSDFEVKMDEITKIKGRAVNKNIPVEFFRTKRNINSGEILTNDNIEGIPVIKRGANVIANLIKGNVHITLDAVAKQEGRIGERIRIAAKNKYFKAEVIDPYNVKIVE